MSIAVYDSYCGSLNSGDAIIMDAIYAQMSELFPYEHKVAYPTHYPLSYKAIRRIKKSRLCFVGGTNLLSSSIRFRSKKNQWAIGHIGAFVLKKRPILLGCGWKNYQHKSTIKSRIFYQTILSDNFLHSVRDSYSEKKLKDLGISNVINTGCPTLWTLTKDHCAEITQDKSDNVVFTLTDYRKDADADREMIRLLFSLYNKLYVWLQGANDYAYLRSLLNDNELEKIEMIGPTLSEYDLLLDTVAHLDYVGTRLHAGIRAMQKKRRAIIIGVDNRATEKQVDFNLAVVERGNLEKLSELINNAFATQIRLPNENITAWKAQFSGLQEMDI